MKTNYFCRIILSLIADLREDIDVLYDLTGVISSLDIIMSFTKVKKKKKLNHINRLINLDLI